MAVSLAGAIVTIAPSAMAACPQPDPGPLPYVSANTPTKACSAADLALFKAEMTKADATVGAVETAVKAQNAACGACIFTREEDPTWGPFVYRGADGGTGGVPTPNFGGCFERAPGGSTACGTAVTNFADCTQSRCRPGADLCEDKAASDECVQTVIADPASCGAYNYLAACPNIELVATAYCKDVYAVVATLCGSSPPASSPDAGASGSKDRPSGNDANGLEEPGDSSAPAVATPSTSPTASESSGCAQSGSVASSSIPSLLGIALAAFGVARRRRNAKRS